MIFIIMNNNNILNISKTTDSIYHNIFNYIKIIIYCNKNKINYLKQIKIYCYDDCIPVNIMTIDNNLNLIDNIGHIIPINSIVLSNIKLEIINQLNDKSTSISKTKLNEESDINICLPIDEVDECVSDISCDDINTNIYIKPKNIEELNDKIKILKENIENEKNILEENNKKYENKLDSYLECKHKLGLLEIKEKNKKEKEEENRKVFRVDKNIYNIFIEEINNNVRDEDDIPEIFYQKYLIFNKLKEEINESISETEEYNRYNEIKNNISKIDLESKFDDMFIENNNIYNRLSNNLENKEYSSSYHDSNSDSSENDI